MTQLDEHGARILAFVDRYQREHHRSPSYREIGAAVGLASNDHVARDLRRLRQQGYISYTPGVSRSIVLLKTPRVRQRTFPLSHVDSARSPAETIEPVRAPDNRSGRDWTRVAAALFEDEKDVFILRARGAAMQDAMVNDGDLVVVKRGAEPRDGEVAAVWSHTRQHTTLRHVYRENGHLRLDPPDPTARSEYVKANEIEIRGTVLAIVRHTL